MDIYIGIFAVTVFCSSVEAQGTAVSTAIADPKRAAVIHNEMRRLRPSSDMKMLTWDDKLAGEARDYAEKCTFAHDSNAGFVGENIYITTGLSSQLYDSAVESWYSEVSFFDYDTLDCDAGRMCGHYTQVVWANSATIGCGAAECPTIAGVTGFTDSRIVICRYSPPGNFVGQKPYSLGAACTKCPDGWFCNNGLCQDPDTVLTTASTTSSTASTTTSSTTPATTSSTTSESTTPTASTPPSTTTSSSTTTTTRGTTTTQTTQSTTTATTNGSTISSTPRTTTATESPTPNDCTEEYLELRDQWKEALNQWRAAFDEWSAGNCPGS